MDAVTIIGAIAAIAIVGGISFVVDRYSWGTYDYRPFNPKTIWFSFVCGLLVAVGVYLWLGAGFTAIAPFVLVCGIVVYGVLVAFVKWHSNFLIAVWTVTILSALFPVVVPLSTVWFFLKPNDKIDESDDDDELETPPASERKFKPPKRPPTMRNRDRIDDLENRIDEMKGLSDQIDGLERQIERDLSDRIDRLEDRIDRLEDRIDRLEE